MRGRLSVLRDNLRTQLWLLPSIGVAIAIALGVGLPRLDQRIDDELPPWLTTYLFGGGASAARTVLEAIAGSLITVTSLTFSLTVVTLQLASSQYSPRLLRTFSADRLVQLTLALFLSTFTYALTVLRTIRTAGEQRQVFVPQISVTTGFVLALASVLALVAFLSHLAREVRVESVLLRVHSDARQIVRRILPERESASVTGTNIPVPPPGALTLPSPSSGFLARIDEDELLSAAVHADAILHVFCCPGSLLIAGTPVGVGWPRSADSFDEDTRGHLTKRVAKAIDTRSERTTAHDLTYGIRQLVDVAIRALSPGINDPTTAVHALGHLSSLLCLLTRYQLGPQLLRDDRGRIRVVLNRPDFGDLLELAIQQPRRYGAKDPAVLAQLLFLLRDLAWCAAYEHRPVIAEQLVRVRREVTEQDYDATELTRFDGLVRHVEEALEGRWTLD
ncbi:DUF2254 domain-containing protein [Sphaerisporangium sp. TRM90804]|uniref:DUF2254 domain-containing protein n=1 Tax=Sphaerisporangium sp. TRM90804 TaxID=3031113 RepID=UPI00244919F1|nr:DUF2254 domain-containing protein [Sphaerisporangium sp. TRM90804]MDH2426362.1 DUF2254 domain-containing protein [Sphaerisporangium sp. TRM90804]